jgi:hypothetical protein
VSGEGFVLSSFEPSLVEVLPLGSTFSNVSVMVNTACERCFYKSQKKEQQTGVVFVMNFIMR